MAKTKKELHEGIRAKFMALASEWLESIGEEVLRAIPTARPVIWK